MFLALELVELPVDRLMPAFPTTDDLWALDGAGALARCSDALFAEHDAVGNVMGCKVHRFAGSRKIVGTDRGHGDLAPTPAPRA